jgi:hypothetical protein
LAHLLTARRQAPCLRSNDLAVTHWNSTRTGAEPSGHGWQAHLANGTFLVLSLGIVAWVAWDAFSFRLITNSPGADYWEHTAVLRALLDDPWHPQHPLIAGDVPSPRFGPHFVAIALLGRAFGADALAAMSISSVVNTLLFLAGIYLFFREYFRSHFAPLFALVVMFGSWLDAPHFSNVYKLSIYFSVAGYPSTAALAIMLLGLAVFVRALRSERDRPALWALSAFLWACEYITHPLTAMLAFTAAGLLALTEPLVARTRRLWMLGSILAGVVLASLWPYYPALSMVAGGTVHRVQKGLETGEHPLHFFYQPEMMFHVLGFGLLAVLAFPYFVWQRKLLVVPLGTLAMLGVFAVSAFLDVPLGHRFILLSVFFLQIGLVWLLLELLPPRPNGPSTPPLHRAAWIGGAVLAGGLLVTMAVSNALEARDRFKERRTPGDESVTVKYGRRVAELAGPNAVVLGEPLASWPIPTFGPKIVTLHHRNPLITDGKERDVAAERFFGKASDKERFAILERFRVTHVLVSSRQGPGVLRFLQKYGHRRGLPLGRALYRVPRESSPQKPGSNEL